MTYDFPPRVSSRLLRSVNGALAERNARKERASDFRFFAKKELV